MRFYTAIAYSRETPKDVIVFAATYYKNRDAAFTIRNLNLEFLQTNLPAMVIIHGEKLVPSINAACNRTIEKLLLKKLITPNNPPEIELIVSQALARHTYVLPSVVVPRYWLSTVAKNGLKSWLEGDRP
jgi:hypothetical protein